MTINEDFTNLVSPDAANGITAGTDLSSGDANPKEIGDLIWFE